MVLTIGVTVNLTSIVRELSRELNLIVKGNYFGSSIILEVDIPYTDLSDIEDAVESIIRFLKKYGFKRVLRVDLVPQSKSHLLIIKVRR